MASLADLFNPTFLMFLGILVLIVALLVVYFESKMRDQNHKIASMLSLVSTLAEDMNGVKMGLNHLAIRGGQHSSVPVRENLGNNDNEIMHDDNLIELSDGEGSDESDVEEELDTDSESEVDSDNDSDSDEEDDADEEEDEDDIKIVKIQVSNADLDLEDCQESNLQFDIDEDLAEFDSELEPQPQVTNDYVEEVLELKYDLGKEEESEQILEENMLPSSSDLKTISINLGEESEKNDDNIDYKKLQLAKLRSIVVEKGLTNNSEASKLKKPELLKLLGAE
jgi:hypothetical protein